MKEITKKNIEDILALTHMQEGMLYHYLKEPQRDYYCEQLSLRVSGEINPRCFEKAWDYVVQANEMLRTFFRWEKLQKPTQVILKQHTPDVRFFDLSNIQDYDEKQKQLEKIKQKDNKEKFDLREVPFRVSLCKISRDDYCVIMSNHHILLDGWSSGIILKEFFRVYAGLEEGETSLVLPPKPSFKKFIQWHQNSEKDKQKKFWEEYFKGFDTQTRLPIKRKSVKINKVTGDTPVKEFGFTLEKGISDRLDTFLKKHRITLATFFYCSWGILLQKYCNSDDVVFGTTVSGRSAPINGIENMVGLFINTLPLRVTAKTGETVLDLLLKVNETLPHREKYENTPLLDIREYSRGETDRELFDTLLVMENYPLDHFLKEGNNSLPLMVNSYSAVESTNYDFTIVIALHHDIEVRLLYSDELFTKDVILRLSNHFIHILKAITAHPQKQLHEIEILSREERKQLLVDFNDTNEVSGYPREKSIHQLFEEQVEKTTDNIALHGCMIAWMHGEDVSITYKELNEKSNHLAYLLHEKGVGPDIIVGIMMERSIEMVIGIFGILKAGGAYLPMDPDFPQERIQYMIKDSNAKILLTTSGLSEKFEKLSIVNCQLLIVNEMLSNRRRLNNPPKEANSINNYQLTINNSQLERTSLSYIIYTSGSTGKPKGVMVNHGSVVNLLLALQNQYPLMESDIYLLKTSYLFDVSVTELFGWFLEGGRLAILEKEGEKDPGKIVDAIKWAGVTHINFVPSMFHTFVETLDSHNIDKLSSLKYIFLAGEVLLPTSVNRFRRLNTVISLENIYGPTEATVYASWYSLNEGNVDGSIPIGKPLPNVGLYILNKWGNIQPVGVPGELCISGVGLARGYLNQPGLTNEKFLSVPSVSSVAKKIYKTGDLARWLPDGNIEFLGRMDFQVKVRGFRIELGEIENQLLNHPVVKETVLTAQAGKNGDHFICAYVVHFPGKPFKIPGLRHYLQQKLPNYMIPAYFVTLDQIPLTATGKVDRKSLPQPRVISPKKYAAPGNQLEAELVDIWAEVLGIDNKQIGINDNFFELGGHSLKVAGLIGRIHKKLNIEVPFNKIFQAPTVKDLTQYIIQKEESQYSEIPPLEKKEYYPLSSAQKRLFVLQQMEVDCTAYNINGIMGVEGPVEKEKFELVFRQLINRHESLRTSFQMIKEHPVQKVHDEVEFEIEYDQVEVKEEEQTTDDRKQKTASKPGAHLSSSYVIRHLSSESIRPFDLSHAPLLRVGLIKLLHTPSDLRGRPSQEGKGDKYLLIVDMHHIISDGTSVNVLMKDLAALYQGEKLPALGIQYKEFSEWQNCKEEREKIKEQEAFWLKEFAGEIPILNLPTDYSRSVIQDFEGCTVGFEISAKQMRLLKELAADTGITLYILLLALYYILLSKLSGQTDIVVGTPVALCRHGDLERIVGMLVNTLALRNFPNQEKSFEEFLLEIKKRTLDAFANQDYPYEKLVEAVVIDRDTGRNPLFDTMFVLQNIEVTGIKIPGLKIKQYANERTSRISKFDLTLEVFETDDRLVLNVQYSTKLFRKKAIEKLVGYFNKVISSVLTNPGGKISKIEIVSHREKQQVLVDFNNTRAEYPAEETIHHLFEEQVERTPDNISIVGESIRSDANLSITYRELNKRANHLAHLLRKKRLKPGSAVAIMIKRSVEMVVGMLGILKAGGSYLPIDPGYPGDRIHFMLDDSQAAFLLAAPETQVNVKVKVQGETAQPQGLPLQFVNIDTDIESALEPSHSTLTLTLTSTCQVSPANLAYIIYTSGSTGRPKGVLIRHGGFVNLIYFHRRIFGEGPGERMSQVAGPGFDAMAFEVWPCLLNGATLLIADDETRSDPVRMKQWLIEKQITISFQPTVIAEQLLLEEWPRQGASLRALRTAGEQLTRYPGPYLPFQFYNLYGPTEDTVWTTWTEVKAEQKNEKYPTIGKPIANHQVYIMTAGFILQPPGVSGELCIAGEGLAIGYLNRPELTAERFVKIVISHSSFVIHPPGKLSKSSNDQCSFTNDSPDNLSPHSPYSPVYLTGDLARWLPKGNIEFLGRLDQQVKIRGFRIELGEIQGQLEKYAQIKEAIVLARENQNGEKYLCAYIVVAADPSPSIPGLRRYLSQQLPDYMVPPYFVNLDKIPLTPNGKIDRKALPEPDLGIVPEEYTAPRDEKEKKLVEMWSDVLGLEKERIGIDANFFQLGGHSLKATILISKIHKELEVKITLADIFRKPTIRELAGYIKGEAKETYLSIEPVEAKDYYALSSSQKRLYVLHQMDEIGTVYNMYAAMVLKGTIERNRLENSLIKLIDRHESLRTSFDVVNEEPVQRIHDETVIGHWSLVISEVDRGEISDIIKSFVKPFDLSQAPLLRVGLVAMETQTYLLMVDMHHIISDGMSVKIFAQELTALYVGKQLPPLRLQYKDYVQWQSQEKETTAYLRHAVYWQDQFHGDEIPVLELPIDFVRPKVQVFEGKRVNFEMTKKETNRLKDLALHEGTTLYILLLSLFNVFLSKITHQETIVVGTAVAGRRHHYLKQIVGMFVNTLALINYPASQKTFNEFLEEVSRKTSGAFENQDYHFEGLIEKAAVKRDISRNPLFDVMFDLQPISVDEIVMPGLKIEPYNYSTNTAKFDLMLQAVEEKESLRFIFEYSTNLFKQGTIQRFIGFFKKIAAMVLENSAVQLSEIEIISEIEKNQILFQFNNTTLEYPKNKLIHQLFEEEVEKQPDKAAVVYEDQTLSYNELNQRADKLAAYLQSKGVKLEESVGIMLAVSPEMIVSVLAILKTDGAYLPIDPGYPDERKQYMLADSGANVLISTSTLAKEVKKLRNLEAKKNFGVIFIDFFEFTGFSSSHLLNFSTSSSSNLSYIIYTSGSTGRAKGVMVEHRNVVRLVKNTNFIDFKPGNRILQTGALEFDASTFEIWGALLNGLILYMAPKERILDLQILKQLIAANKITIMWITSPLFNQMVLNDVDVFSGLLNLLVGGDVLSPVHINRVRRRFPRLNIINGYGPTENTTFSTTFLIEKEYKESIPIGRPIANSTAYIVDKNGQLQPIGIAGELWVGGDGVSRGYMNNPELTAKKFDHDLLDYQDYQDKKRKVENIRSLEVKKKKKNYNHHSPLTTTPLHHSPIYKTGDLARWLVDGNIEFSGRIDQQVKIRGFRVEPGEIENHLLSHEHIKEAVVQVKKEENGDKYLCAYIVSPRRLLSPDLKEFLSIDLPGYMIPSCFVILEKIPLTPNGKVDRRSLPEPEIVINEGQSQGPRDEVETKITALWAEVLGIEKNILNINSDFFELGGHSLKAALLISKIHKTFDVNIPLTEIFTSPTIKELAAYIKEAVKDKYISIEPTEKKEYHALSSAQKRLYVLYQMDEEGIGYNIPSFLLLEGSPDKDRLDEISRKLIKRHESLRTSFHIIKEEPVQRIHDKVEFEIEGVAPSTYKENSLKKTQKDTKKEDIKSQELRAKNCIKTFIRPFDLSQTPLMRVGLIKIEETKCIFMLDMHHIISDGISMEIFTKDFMESYAGNRLSSLKLQYKDYAAWQNREKESRAQLRQAVYWQNQFSSDEMPIFELPTDFARPQIQSFEGRRTNFEITHEKTRQLKMLALEDGTTLYMVLLSLFNVFLSKITGQKSILIGTVVRGRRHADLEQIIGMFVNTLALINYPGNQKTFYEFLREVNKKTLQAFENQDYPLEYLVEEVFINRDTSRNPLFDVMFVLQDMNIQEIEIPGLRLQPYNYESNIAKFDLMLQVLEKKENLRFIFEYSTKLFKEETIQRFIGYFKTVVDVVLENPLVKLSGIEILPGEEKHRLLFEFNDTTSEYPKNKTLSLLFEDQVRRTPDHTALIGQIPNPKSQIPNLPAKDPYKKESFAEGYLSYKELNKKSNHLAHLLQEKGTQPDTIVGIMVERSVEMIIGILGILKAGGAYLPIDPDYPQERKQYILDDSSAKILVTAPGLPGEFEKLLIVNCRLLMVNEKPSNRRRLNNPPREANSINNYQLTINNLQLEKASLAYIIYTSGTTGKPKGVMIEHRNVVRLMFNDKFQFDFNNNDVWTMFHSYCFDFSVWEMYGALLYGGKLVLIPRATARDSQRYLEVLKEKKVTILNQTPSAFYNLMNLELKKPRKELYIRWIIFGGETLIPVRLKEWKARYPGTKLINMYGITETTVHVTFKEIKNEEIASTASSIGKPIPTLSTYVLDKSLRLLPIGIPGELCVGGKGVGRGYLNQPELTGDKFINNPYIPGERLYRSGDLVKMSARGNMEYLGRIDYQVKIRGFRIELAEIESQLLTHGEIEDVVVTIKENTAGDKHLFAYVASHKDRLTAPGLREYLLKKLPEYMIPSFFIFLEKIPLTPNGKVDRKALPEPEIKAGQGYTAPGNEVEEKLAGIWAETLGIPQNTIGIDSSFFEMGGHSLKAALLLSKIHKEFDVSVSLVEIFSIPTIRELAAYIKKAAKDKYISIKPVEKKEYYTLSSAQKRLYVLHQMDEQGIGYNIPSVWNVEGDIDEIKFEKVFCELIQRHESLRTSFAILGDEPVQKIHDKVEFKIETGTHHSFVRPFDLSRSPLLRVGLLGIDIQTHFLMIDMHHIISDGTSMKVLVKDFMAMYGGKELSPLGIQYKDFSEWQNSKKQKEWIKQQKTYWQNQFENEIPVLNLPTDYSRPVIQHFQGSALHFELDAVHTRELNNYALEQGVTLYMVLLSLYMVFLGKLSSQDDIVVGTPVAGRKHADLEPIIGMFVNTLALRNFPHRQKIFNQFLREIKERTLQAFTHQDYPYEDLVEAVAVNRDPSRNPLFDTMFAMQNIDALQLEGEIPGLKLKQYDYETRIAKFDISLYAVESGKNLNFSMEYNTSLFKKETIRRFIGYLNKITSTVLENRDIRIYEIDILSEEEKNRILLNFNDTGVEYPRDKTIHQLFAEQVEQRPDNIALHGCMIAWMHGEEGAITYKELNEKSNQLAHVLQSKGMDSDTIVGIMVERSIEMIIGILGILKAGGAYLPIDIGYPRERIDYMLKDSGVYILLTALEIAGFSSPQAFNNRLKGTSFNLHLSPSPVTSLAYVIYTSGSTGKPKGVMVEHPSVVNLLWALQKEYPLRNPDAYLMKTSFLFDVSVTELFGWTIGGGRVVVLPEGGEKDPAKIFDIVEKTGVTHINFVPSMFNAFLEALSSLDIEKLSGLKYIFLAGEALLSQLVKKFRLLNIKIILENIYGPTETTVYASKYSLSDWEGSENIPIGKPISNTNLYILDKNNRLQPIGTAGELCIGGSGLSRGYLNKPELTKERFIEKKVKVEEEEEPFGQIINAFGEGEAHKLHELTRMRAISSQKLLRGSPDASRGGFLEKSPPGRRRQKIYKTGDLAQWLPDGNIEFLGRIDYQVKIRGFRIELGEIESQLLKHDEIKEAVVVTKIDEKRDTYLCAYIVSEIELSGAELRKFLSVKLPEYMIPSYFVLLEKIPLAPNGKIDRKALPEPLFKVEENYAAPGDAVEEKLVEIWREVLTPAGHSQIGIDDNFFQLGGQSLKAIVMAAKIHKEFNVRLPLAEIFKTLTIRGLSGGIKELAQDKYAAIEPIEKKEFYKLSSAQKRLYISQQMDLSSTAYNMPGIFILEGKLNRKQLENVFCCLANRHEVFRTCFCLVNDEPVQKIENQVDLEISFKEISTGDAGEEAAKNRIKEFVKPFDLNKAPLLRFQILQLKQQQHFVLFDIHHIISDGISMKILQDELAALYEGKSPEPLRIHYKDYAHWQDILLNAENLKKQEQYWLKKMKEFELTRLPLKEGRLDLHRHFKGERKKLVIHKEIVEKIEAFVNKYQVTRFMVMITIFNILLTREIAQMEITIGIPYANREHYDLKKVIGIFLNVILIRTVLDPEDTFLLALDKTKQTVIEAMQNSSYPYELLNEKMRKINHIKESDLFTIMFNYFHQEEKSKDTLSGNIKIKSLDLLEIFPKNDVTLYIQDTGNEMELNLVYRGNLFEEHRMQRIMDNILYLINMILEDENAKITDIDMMDRVNPNKLDFESEMNELFEQQDLF